MINYRLIIVIVVFAILPAFAPIIFLIVISPTASWEWLEWMPGGDLVGLGELHESGHDDLRRVADMAAGAANIARNTEKSNLRNLNDGSHPAMV